MLAVRPGQPEHLTPTKSHQRRGFRYFDPARRQILQHAHPVDLRPAHRNHRHRPKTPQPKPWRVTSLSGPTVTSLSGVYISCSHNERLWNLPTATMRSAGRADRPFGWETPLFSLKRTVPGLSIRFVRHEAGGATSPCTAPMSTTCMK